MRCGVGFLTVTTNLEAALKQLRQSHQTVTLWVDAICIDQTNLEERSELIRYMGRIFHQADKVIIWLAARNTTRDDQVCIHVFQKVAESVREEILVPLNAEDHDSIVHHLDRQIESLMAPLITGYGSMLEQFFHRPGSRDDGSSRKLCWLLTPSFNVGHHRYLGYSSRLCFLSCIIVSMVISENSTLHTCRRQ